MAKNFEYFDFVPRKQFEIGANELLSKICKKFPDSFSCEARCTFFANKFFFQILFRDGENTISSQTILDPKKDQTNKRDWQIKAIEKMVLHIQKQIESLNSPEYKNKKAAS